jgi:hypothetical protein
MGVVIEILIKYPRGELELSSLIYVAYVYYVLLLHGVCAHRFYIFLAPPEHLGWWWWGIRSASNPQNSIDFRITNPIKNRSVHSTITRLKCCLCVLAVLFYPPHPPAPLAFLTSCPKSPLLSYITHMTSPCGSSSA